MTQSVLITAVFAAVSLPIAIFLYVALFSRKAARLQSGVSVSSRSAEAENYLLAGKEATTGDFINSSTGYMIQVSTTFYFIYWGYNYGLSNIFYLISWSIGIIVFASFARSIYTSREIASSIPSFISHKSSSALRLISALAAILSFGGVFYVEAFFTADLISGFASNDGSVARFSQEWWVTFSIVVIAVSFYSVLGGLKKVIVTDVWQLSFAYFGFAITFAYLLSKSVDVSPINFLVMSFIVVAIYVCFIVTDRGLFDSRVKIITLLLSLLIIISSIINSAAGSWNQIFTGEFLIDGPFKQIVEPWGWVTLAGFVVLNSLWQFADSSNFQRINSINFKETEDEGIARLRKMIISLAIVSPLTWGLGIILGILIKAAAIDVAGPGFEYQGLLTILRDGALAGEYMSLFVIVALTFGLVSIMMSTSDSAIIAATQNFSTDVFKVENFRQSVAICFAALMVFIVGGIAMWHGSLPNANILTVMAGAYSMIIVLAPLTIAKLLGASVNPLLACAAIVVGAGAAMYATFGPVQDLPLNVQLVLPIFAATVPAVALTAIGAIIARPRAA